jgi:hypothetical protein
VTEINSSLSHPPNQPNPDRRQPSKFQQLVVFIIIIIIIIVAKTTGNNISSFTNGSFWTRPLPVHKGHIRL